MNLLKLLILFILILNVGVSISNAIKINKTSIPTPLKPVEEPTQVPTDMPTQGPTQVPTNIPTNRPTQVPTQGPTNKPTQDPKLYVPYCARYNSDTYGWGKLWCLDNFDQSFLDGGRNYSLNTVKASGFSNKIKTMRFGPGKGGILLDGEVYTGYIDTFCSRITKGLLVDYKNQKMYGFTLPLAYTDSNEIWDWIDIYDIDVNNSTKISDIKNYVLRDDEDPTEGVSYTNFIFSSRSPNSYFKYFK